MSPVPSNELRGKNLYVISHPIFLDDKLVSLEGLYMIEPPKVNKGW